VKVEAEIEPAVVAAVVVRIAVAEVAPVVVVVFLL